MHPGSSLSRSQLAAIALLRVIAGAILLSALLVVPAGTLAYWQAWTFQATLFIPMALTMVYLLMRDPELLERRLRTGEKDPAQRWIVALAAALLLTMVSIPGFDRRFGWSHVAVPVVIGAHLLLLVGYGLFLRVLRENRSASRTVTVESGQRVVATGPYAIVRHPMYAAITVMGLATPVALGSWWAGIPALLLVGVLAARINSEERLLANELTGYREYMRTTSYRLIPGVW